MYKKNTTMSQFDIEQMLSICILGLPVMPEQMARDLLFSCR